MTTAKLDFPFSDCTLGRDHLNITTSVLTKEQVLAVEDTRNSPFMDIRVASQYHSLSGIAVLLIAGGHKLGAVIIGYNTVCQFTDAANALVSILSIEAGIFRPAMAKIASSLASQFQSQGEGDDLLVVPCEWKEFNQFDLPSIPQANFLNNKGLNGIILAISGYPSIWSLWI